jgi:hypothetical protein
LTNNRKSIAAQQKESAAATKARKDREVQEAARREHDITAIMAAQDNADEEFARQVEEAVQKRGEDLMRPIRREGPGGGTGITTPQGGR